MHQTAEAEQTLETNSAGGAANNAHSTTIIVVPGKNSPNVADTGAADANSADWMKRAFDAKHEHEDTGLQIVSTNEEIGALVLLPF